MVGERLSRYIALFCDIGGEEVFWVFFSSSTIPAKVTIGYSLVSFPFRNVLLENPWWGEFLSVPVALLLIVSIFAHWLAACWFIILRVRLSSTPQKGSDVPFLFPIFQFLELIFQSPLNQICPNVQSFRIHELMTAIVQVAAHFPWSCWLSELSMWHLKVKDQVQS